MPSGSPPPLPHTMASFSHCNIVSMCSPALPAHHTLHVKRAPLAPLTAAPAKTQQEHPHLLPAPSAPTCTVCIMSCMSSGWSHTTNSSSRCAALHTCVAPCKERRRGTRAWQHRHLERNRKWLRHCEALVLGREETVLQCSLRILPCHHDHLRLSRQHLLIPSLMNT